MIKVVGINELQKALDTSKTERLIRKVILYHGARLNSEMARRAVFRGHREGARWVSPTGATRRSIRPQLRSNGYQVAVGPHTSYAAYLEHGTRYMGAQPFVRPALDAVREGFLRDMAHIEAGGKL